MKDPNGGVVPLNRPDFARSPCAPKHPMKAIRVSSFGGPDVLRLEQMVDPKPTAGQVLVRLNAIGVNPVDAYMRSGQYPRKPTLPYTPGSDAAGIVEEVGAEVSSLQKGQRVYIYQSLSGAYAELALCEPAQVHPLPSLISFAQGAALGVPYATAYYALVQRAQALAGETVLVNGASGSVGLAAVQWARSRGLLVIGTAGTPEGLKLILQEGVQAGFNYHDPDTFEQILKWTNGRGVDIILEMMANVNLGNDLKLLAARGRVIVIGSRGSVELDPRETMGRNSDIRGMSLFNATPFDLAGIHSAIFAGLENGSLRPTIAQEIPLAEAARAHEAVLGKGNNGKIVLIP